MFGHFASSHTVARPKERTVARSSWYFGEVAGAALSHLGLGSILSDFGGAFLRSTTTAGSWNNDDDGGDDDAPDTADDTANSRRDDPSRSNRERRLSRREEDLPTPPP